METDSHTRAGLWRALALSLAGLILFGLLFNFLLPNLGSQLTPLQLVLLGLILALVPAALWLVFFYAFDHKSPEPRWLVLLVFMGGAVLCAALREPLLSVLLQEMGAAANPWWLALVENILVVGVLEMAMVYVAVRVLAFDRSEFDERVDGVVYGVAAGLGIATVVNFTYVLAHGGVDLDTGSMRMVINTLAYASAGGVLGYCIGQARFERAPWYYLPLGLLLAAALNGALFTALEPSATALQPRDPWVDLAIATAVAVLALVAVFVLVARANEETDRLTRSEPRPLQPAPAYWIGPPDPYASLPAAAGQRAGPDAPLSATTPATEAAPPPEPLPARPEKGNPYGGGR